VRVGATRVARLDRQIFCGDVKEKVIVYDFAAGLIGTTDVKLGPGL
jgi:hypothetical protein